jgi:hypothetical protein
MRGFGKRLEANLARSKVPWTGLRTIFSIWGVNLCIEELSRAMDTSNQNHIGELVPMTS